MLRVVSFKVRGQEMLTGKGKTGLRQSCYSGRACPRRSDLRGGVWCYVTQEKPELGHAWLSGMQPPINTPLSSYIGAPWKCSQRGSQASALDPQAFLACHVALDPSQRAVCQNSGGSVPTVPSATFMKPTCSHCFNATLHGSRPVISLCLH